MDLLNDKLSKVYIKFLLSAFGSSFIASIYGFVDMIVVGKYHGPQGAAAMAVIAPVWNIIYSMGLLVGMGGSVLYAFEKGKTRESGEHNVYFTASVVLGVIVSLVLWICLYCFETPLLRLFGASEDLLPLCREYLVAPKMAVPIFVFTQILSMFLRNDSAPALATKAVLAGGVFNIFGDIFCVFTLDMGIKGAGIATAAGAAVSVLAAMTHFFTKENTLKFRMPRKCFGRFPRIISAGFSSFVIDVAMGVLTMLFNRQIMKYSNSEALAVYGVIVSVSTFVQCCSYGVGQASQPIISQNYGARKFDRIIKMIRYNVITTVIISIIWTAAAMVFPNGFIRLFMAPTKEVLDIAPAIMRMYAVSYLLLPFNIYSTYYFQSTMKSGVSMAISVTRGILLSGTLIMVLPRIAGAAAMWWAMPITEAAVFIFIVYQMRKQVRLMKSI